MGRVIVQMGDFSCPVWYTSTIRVLRGDVKRQNSFRHFPSWVEGASDKGQVASCKLQVAVKCLQPATCHLQLGSSFVQDRKCTALSKMRVDIHLDDIITCRQHKIVTVGQTQWLLKCATFVRRPGRNDTP